LLFASGWRGRQDLTGFWVVNIKYLVAALAEGTEEFTIDVQCTAKSESKAGRLYRRW